MPRTILIADDDQSLTQQICLALEEQGYGVYVAQNSEEVINHIMIRQVDLLILSQDIAPHGGLDVLHQLRRQQILPSLPIIFLTADMEEADVYNAWRDGVDSFQSKRESALPVLTSELVVKIKRIFQSLGKA